MSGAQRLLITGAGGFLGRNCLQVLAAQDWEIHAADRRSTESAGTDITWHEVDLLDPEAVDRLLKALRPTHLLHLAWTSARPVYQSSENFAWVEAGVRLFSSFADRGGTRIVAAGSSAEYDWSHGICREEETPISTATLYGAAKAALSILFRALCRERGVSGAWARPFFLYGPHEHPERLVASVVTALLREEPARCTHGRQVRDYLYSRDAAAALVHLLAAEVEGVVNVASGRPIAVAELVGAVADLLDRRHLLRMGAIPAAPDEAPRVTADIARLSSEAGWSPTRTLEQGLLDTIAWWRAELDRSSPAGKDS